MDKKSSLARGKWIEAQIRCWPFRAWWSSLARGKWIEAVLLNSSIGFKMRLPSQEGSGLKPYNPVLASPEGRVFPRKREVD